MFHYVKFISNLYEIIVINLQLISDKTRNIFIMIFSKLIRNSVVSIYDHCVENIANLEAKCRKILEECRPRLQLT